MTKKTRISLKIRFVTFMGLIIVSFLAVLLIFVTEVSNRNLRNSFDKGNVSYAELATKTIGDSFIKNSLGSQASTLRQVASLNNSTDNIAVFDANDKPILGLRQKPSLTLTESQFSAVQKNYLLSTYPTYTQITYPYHDSFGTLRYIVKYQFTAVNATAGSKQIVSSLLPLVVSALFIFSIVFFVLINHFILGPIKDVRDIAITIGHGNLDNQIAPKRNDEVGDLAMSVNQMANALKDDIRKLKEADELKSEFIMISSHNLRTPIATIQGYLELLENISLNEQSKKMVNGVKTAVNRLNNFTEDMLTISNTEANRNGIQYESITIANLMGPLIAEFHPIVQERGLIFNEGADNPSLVLMVNPTLLRSALRNLLDNACKFTSTGGRIDFLARTQDNNIFISVKDTGIGIAADEIPKLFTKFHRGTSTLNYNYEGIGIGLYATKLIVDQHHGTIMVNSHPGQGSEFTISLPLAADKTSSPIGSK